MLTEGLINARNSARGYAINYALQQVIKRDDAFVAIQFHLFLP